MLADGIPVTPTAGPEQGYKIIAQAAGGRDHRQDAAGAAQQPEQPDRRGLHARGAARAGRRAGEHPRLLIGTDDMYEKIYWAPEPFASLVTVAPELYERTVTINGCSKAYAMTGWRIGYCGGPKEIITAMTTIQGQSTSNASSISQKAAVAALNGDQQCVADMNRAFKERHDYVVAALNSLPGVSCLPGAGTFYAFADVRGAMRNLGLRDDNAFCEYLINKARRRRGRRLGLRRARAHAAVVCLQHGRCSRRPSSACAPCCRASGPGQDGLSRPVRPVGSRGRRARTLARRHCGNYLFTNSGNRSSLAT